MRLRVFGNNSDDKGSQLEQLARRVLERLGYKQIALNIIGSGGSEVDVRAEYPNLRPSRRASLHLIGECKSYDSPITFPDWLKLLGKIYSEKARRPDQVRGVFVDLSGANGNVIGAVEDQKTKDSTVDLITCGRLAELVIEEFNLPSVERELNHVLQFTKDSVTEVSLVTPITAGMPLLSIGTGCTTDNRATKTRQRQQSPKCSAGGHSGEGPRRGTRRAQAAD